MDRPLKCTLLIPRSIHLGLDQAAIRRLERMSVEGGFPAESLAVRHWMGTWHPGGRAKQARRFLLQQRRRFGLARFTRTHHDVERTSERNRT